MKWSGQFERLGYLFQIVYDIQDNIFLCLTKKYCKLRNGLSENDLQTIRIDLSLDNIMQIYFKILFDRYLVISFSSLTYRFKTF